MTLKECMLINNRCYQTSEPMTNNQPVGIVVHSTSADNPYIKRYVQPIKSQSYYDEVIDDIGYNKNGNSWNRSTISKCVHAFIGNNKDQVVETYQTLPFTVCCWGVGKGKKGSYNYNPTAHIQIEICEDDLTNESYFNSVMTEAQELCAYLCNAYTLSVDSIVSHKECYKLGYGSNHTDCDHWLEKFNKNMSWFRSKVTDLLNANYEKKPKYTVQVGSYSVKANAQKMLARLEKAGFNGYIKIKE